MRALIDEIDVTAPQLPAENWAFLKQGVREGSLLPVLPCCGQPCYCRESKYGLQHFVHKVKKDCGFKPETWQHLEIKSVVLQACLDAGWEAQVEVVGTD